MDTGPSMETTAAAHYRPVPHRYLMQPRLKGGSRRFFPRPPCLPVPVLVLPPLPWLKLHSDAGGSHVRVLKRGYPETPSRGRLAQWVKKAWDQIGGKVVLSSWGEVGLLLPLDGSGDDAWAKKELHSDAQANLLDADTGEEEAEPGAGEEDLLEVFGISDDVDTGVVTEGDDDDDVEEVGRGVELGAGDGPNEMAGGGASEGTGGGAGEPPAVDVT